MPNTTFNSSSNLGGCNNMNSSSIAQNYSHFIGKVFQLTENNVMVEEVIAEGNFFLECFKIDYGFRLF